MKHTDRIQILKGKELELFEEKLKEQFGIKKIEGTIMKKGEEKVFLFSGNITEENFRLLEENVFIERVGTYIAKIEEYGIRLSIEGSQILKDQITENIIDLDEEEMNTWMHGEEVLKETENTGYVIIRYKEDMLGTGKASKQKITNFIPKSRRLKHKQN